jgi:CDP-diacylglycerol--serine O-phosphatidyltransferase
LLRYLYDLPNAITAAGLILTTISLNFILRGNISLAIVLLVWAVMLDHIDGWVARRSRNRPEEYGHFGGDLDSLTDFVSAAVAPWLIVAYLNGTGQLTFACGLVLFLAAGLRVAYFNNFGLKNDGRFYGLPLTYNVPITGLILVLDRYFPGVSAASVLPWVLIVLAAMHVAPFGPPPVRGIGFPLVFAYAGLLTIAMLV